ncbi:hypothetical protein [Nocardia cyriacigeorgica]|uniref:Uncharacterized protein n=1 Tax=Nocardia cyriacigeorgica TaxID=135487 RepID=A0A5R8ND96_9NOCA|nr:hypothetical protein [Nocardia cyriacigeorgica]MBF6095736.1 hypothetical protein [Nocardia cyriacigeorgica]TLF73662.1 hypothetical protein FEK34_26605 [Nocardia cyriacigeorgica]TLG10247.1 hypothetical protein FEK35_13675 [Nocardia cyriacigeorgica]
MSTPTIDTTTTTAPPELRTDTETALWNALTTNPGQTAAELAKAAGIGGSTARKTLARWAADHHVRRESSPDPRSADTWSATPSPTDDVDAAQPEPASELAEQSDTGGTGTDEAADETDGAAQEPEQTEPKPDEAEPTVAEDGDGKPDKLPPGGLRGQVEDYLRDHPGESFTPHQIGKALERSSGAVHNALVKLAANGVAVQTNDAPKKFALE